PVSRWKGRCRSSSRKCGCFICACTRNEERAMKEIIEVPVLSAWVRKIGVPLSLVTKGAGLVFVSGTPPLDVITGALVKGDIEVQTEAAFPALKHCLAAAGTSPDNILMVRIYAANAGF